MRLILSHFNSDKSRPFQLTLALNRQQKQGYFQFKYVLPIQPSFKLWTLKTKFKNDVHRFIKNLGLQKPRVEKCYKTDGTQLCKEYAMVKGPIPGMREQAGLLHSVI